MAMTKLPRYLAEPQACTKAGGAVYRVYRIDAPPLRARCLSGEIQENSAMRPLI
jgi:hypothetical protein